MFHEILFYAMFMLMIWRRRLGIIIVGCWLAASLLDLAPIALADKASFYVSHLHLLFGMGMISAWVLRRGRVAMPRLLASGGAALFLFAGVTEVYHPILPTALMDLVFGIASALILAGLVELERQGRLDTPTWLVMVGEASYSIYLTHFVTLSGAAKLLLQPLHSLNVPPSCAYVCLATLTVLVGIAFHVFLERPLLHRLKGNPTQADGSVSTPSTAPSYERLRRISHGARSAVKRYAARNSGRL